MTNIPTPEADFVVAYDVARERFDQALQRKAERRGAAGVRDDSRLAGAIDAGVAAVLERRRQRRVAGMRQLRARLRAALLQRADRMKLRPARDPKRGAWTQDRAIAVWYANLKPPRGRYYPVRHVGQWTLGDTPGAHSTVEPDGTGVYHFVIRPDWIGRVYRRGLATVQRRFVLDAEPTDLVLHADETYRVTYVHHGVGHHIEARPALCIRVHGRTALVPGTERRHAEKRVRQLIYEHHKELHP